MKNPFTQFKLLPKQTKLLFSTGMLLAFLVALPLFVNTLLNQNFDIRNRASGVKQGEIILNESASQTQTNSFPVIPVALGVLILSLILIVIGIKKSRSVIK